MLNQRLLTWSWNAIFFPPANVQALENWNSRGQAGLPVLAPTSRNYGSLRSGWCGRTLDASWCWRPRSIPRTLRHPSARDLLESLAALLQALSLFFFVVHLEVIPRLKMGNCTFQYLSPLANICTHVRDLSNCCSPTWLMELLQLQFRKKNPERRLQAVSIHIWRCRRRG